MMLPLPKQKINKFVYLFNVYFSCYHLCKCLGYIRISLQEYQKFRIYKNLFGNTIKVSVIQESFRQFQNRLPTKDNIFRTTDQMGISVKLKLFFSSNKLMLNRNDQVISFSRHQRAASLHFRWQYVFHTSVLLYQLFSLLLLHESQRGQHCFRSENF